MDYDDLKGRWTQQYDFSDAKKFSKTIQRKYSEQYQNAIYLLDIGTREAIQMANDMFEDIPVIKNFSFTSSGVDIPNIFVA